jgi:hypothetical protein
MLMSESFSFAFLLLIVGLTYLANFFLHRMNTYPLTFEHEVSERIFKIIQSQTILFYLIRNDILIHLLRNMLIEI